MVFDIGHEHRIRRVRRCKDVERLRGVGKTVHTKVPSGKTKGTGHDGS